MNAARMLRYVRRHAGLTQRQLAERAGVPQSTVARVERGQLVPRVDTFDRLLRAAGRRLDAVERGGKGVDRSQIRALRRLGPEQRALLAAADAAGLEQVLTARRRARG